MRLINRHPDRGGRLLLILLPCCRSCKHYTLQRTSEVENKINIAERHAGARIANRQNKNDTYDKQKQEQQ